MTARQKILIAASGALIAVFLLIWAAKALFFKPLLEIDKQIAGARERLDTVKQEQRAFFNTEEYLRQTAQRAFSDKADLASARAGEMLTAAILRVGLNDADFNRVPLGTAPVRGATEIAWRIQGEGSLAKIVQLILLLEKSATLHRIDSLNLSPGQHPGSVRANFRFASLVFNPPADASFLDMKKSFVTTETDQARYGIILQRDLFQPYIKPLTADANATNAAGGSATGPENFRIVSLSEWNGQAEIHLRDLAKEETRKLIPGESLAGGEIVLVDYRPRSIPGKGGLLSYSRVIVKIGSEYWAIERGQTLAEKYRLMPEELPDPLNHSGAK